MSAPYYNSYTYSATNAPDYSDFIANVSPKDSPFLTMINSNGAVARLKQNVTDTLTSPLQSGANAGIIKDVAMQNALPEGALLTPQSGTVREVESNYMQIFRKVIQVTATQEEVAKYGGVQSEIGYQIKKSFTELATEVEASFVQGTGHAGASAGDATAQARRLSGLIEKITSNAVTAVALTNTGANTGLFSDTTASLKRYENKLNDLFDTMWETGQPCDTVLVGGRQKRRISELTDKVTRNIEASQKTQILSINMYDSDFGTVNIILDRYVPDVNIIAVALEMWEVSYLRRFNQVKLAKTGDNTQIAIVGELTLDGKTERAGGKITFG